jgi:outer membrane murein-binding lipoprotein Lpp
LEVELFGERSGTRKRANYTKPVRANFNIEEFFNQRYCNVTLNLQTKYLIEIVALTSILLFSLVGFSLAYFSHQPQINNLNTELSDLQGQLNSNVTSLSDNLSVMRAIINALQLQNASLNASIDTLEDNYSSLRANF